MIDVVRYEEKGKRKGYGYTTLGPSRKKIIVYDRVGCKAKRTDICARCGKERTRTFIITEDVSPFNLDNRGLPKSRERIYIESYRKSAELMLRPFICTSCEDKE